MLKNRLKELRKQRNMTGDELAAKIGASHSYIYMIENGQRKPSLGMAKRIADVLGTTIDEIFYA